MLITPRFVIDCFHIMIFESLGLEVSERYVGNNIEEMFVDFWGNITAEYMKKRKMKEEKVRKERKVKEDKQTDFF